MKTFPSALALMGVVLVNLACGHKQDSREMKELSKVSVSLVAQGLTEDGTWVAATLQSTRTAALSTRMAAQVKGVHAQEGQRVRAGAAEYPFRADPWARDILLEGLDEIGQTLRGIGRVEAFEQRRASSAPWL